MNPKKKEPLLLIPPIFTLKPFLGLRAKNKERSSHHVNLRVLWGCERVKKSLVSFTSSDPIHPSIDRWPQQHNTPKSFLVSLLPTPIHGGGGHNNTILQSLLVSLIFILLMFGRPHGWPQSHKTPPPPFFLSFFFWVFSHVSSLSRDSVPVLCSIYLSLFGTMFFDSSNGRGPNIGPKM